MKIVQNRKKTYDKLDEVLKTEYLNHEQIRIIYNLLILENFYQSDRIDDRIIILAMNKIIEVKNEKINSGVIVKKYFLTEKGREKIKKLLYFKRKLEKLYHSTTTPNSTEINNTD